MGIGRDSEKNTATIDVTPDAGILVVLANTPLRPIDALCELIDNALDSFAAARREGLSIDNRWVRVDVPTPAQVQRGEGVVRVVDNGIGLDQDGLEGALKAGFSTKNRFGALGLFGVGFNIATAKLGRITTVTTLRADSAGRLADAALRATLDLPKMREAGTFQVPLESVSPTERGTVVEVHDWWPPGMANDGFALDLAKIPKARLVEQLGRRYASILRDSDLKVHLTVNEIKVTPFEHCVWGEDRSVTRSGARIPALSKFDQVLREVRRCRKDSCEIPEGKNVCPACDGTETTTVTERVHGWIGVQRYDHTSDFGIDIIRNGRAIRVAEKDAFFSFTNDLGISEKEYPVDQLTGRIVGEVHMDHVPVDYTKQDFERPSREWQEAINFLRGGGLQPRNRPDGVKNDSPVGRIFTGYRRVKKFGKEDLYMGTWGGTGPVRISREVEAELIARFRARETGYVDDSKWWELVESANRPPTRPLINCASCGAQNRDQEIECVGCGELLRSKECVKCNAKIRIDANSCVHCGVDQMPVVLAPWRCEVCNHTNGPESKSCSSCSSGRGTPNPLSRDVLIQGSSREDELCIEHTRFELLDGTLSDSISVVVYRVPLGHLRIPGRAQSLPSYAPPGTLDVIELFMDFEHPIFTEMGLTPQQAVGAQVSTFLHAVSGGQQVGRSALNLSYGVLKEAYGSRMSITRESILDRSSSLISQIVENLVDADLVGQFEGQLTSEEQEQFVQGAQRDGDLEKVKQLEASGRYLTYVPGALPRLLRMSRPNWLGLVFEDELSHLTRFPEETLNRTRDRNMNSIVRSVEEIVEFQLMPVTDRIVLKRVAASIEYLELLIS